MSDVIWKGPDSLRQLLVPIDHIDQLPGNPRRGDVESVADSLDEFGQRKPVVARRTTPVAPGPPWPKQHELRGTAEAGNHVTKAALSLGWTHVAVVFVDEDEETGNRYALADNRTHDLGTDDLGDLYLMLDRLDAAKLLAGTGWNPDDVSALRAELNPEPGAEHRSPVDVPVPQALWPVVRLLLEPSVHKMWMKLWIDLPGDTDTEKVIAIIDRMAP